MNPLSIKPLPLLAGALAALSIGFGGGWVVNGWRLSGEIQAITAEHARAIAKQAQGALKNEQAHRAKEQALTKKLNEAQHAAKERETILLADAGRARTESERMRGDLAAIRTQLPSLTEQAIRRYADAGSVVFDQCQRRYQELAAIADQCHSDVKTLEDAWPR